MLEKLFSRQRIRECADHHPDLIRLTSTLVRYDWMLILASRQARLQGDYHPAVLIAERSAGFYRKLPQRTDQENLAMAAAIDAQGRAFCDWGKWERASELYFFALDLLAEVDPDNEKLERGVKSRKASVASNLASLYTLRTDGKDDLRGAESHLNASAKMYQELRRQDGLDFANIRRMVLLRRGGDPESAYDLGSRLQKLQFQRGKRDPLISLERGEARIAMEDLGSGGLCYAERHLETALHLAERVPAYHRMRTDIQRSLSIAQMRRHPGGSGMPNFTIIDLANVFLAYAAMGVDYELDRINREVEAVLERGLVNSLGLLRDDPSVESLYRKVLNVEAARQERHH